MKRILTLLLALLIIIPLFSFSISAEETSSQKCEYCENPEGECPDSDEDGVCDKQARDEKEESFWDKVVAFCENVGKFFKFIFNFFDIFEFDSESSGDTLTSGGFNLIEPNGQLNKAISKIYKVMYPIGFITMLICWGFGVAKSTISSSLDIKDKNSIIHSIISLILGLGAMSLTPQILTVLTGASKSLCEMIGSSGAASISSSYYAQTNIIDLILGDLETSATTLIVVLFLDLIFIINILWIALLQSLSPIFIGLMANKSTRKIGFNFIKEYFKAILIPIVTVAYWCLMHSFQLDFNNLGSGAGIVTGLLGTLVLAISTLSVAGKKLDKLIN